MAKTTGSRYLAEAFKSYGVSHVFLIPTIAVYAIAEMESLGIQVVSTHSEKAAAYMADGYARISGKPGIAMAQTIGSSNLASGLRDAFMGQSPVIAINGGRSALSQYRGVYQEVEDFSSFAYLTKLNMQLNDVRRLPDMIRSCFRTATTGAPGPVHIELAGPLGEILDHEFDVDPQTGPDSEERFSSTPPFRPLAEADAIRRAVELLAQASKPVIVAGGGVVRSKAQRELVAFAERYSIPVATSLNAKSTIAEDHPLGVGVVGGYSRPSANKTVAEADLVFFVGSHTGSQVTGGWMLPPARTPVIQLDLNPEELGHNYANVVSLHGDAGATLTAMRSIDVPIANRDAWLARTSGFVAEWRETNAKLMNSPAVPIRPERICAELTKVLPDNGVVVADTGHAGIWTADFVDLHPGQGYLRAAGSLGWAVPATIGAQCADLNRPVVCFTGDGGAYYHIAELETAARYNIPATIIVNDNRSLNQGRNYYDSPYHGTPTERGRRTWVYEDRNFATIAEAFGVRGIRVEEPDDIADAVKEAIAHPGPVVVDIASDIDALAEPPYGCSGSYGP